MENKKLVKILIKDMAELEELIAEMKSSHRFDILEMEFIHTRARGVQQLLQMLEHNEEPAMMKAEEPASVVEKLKEKVEEAVQAVVITAGAQQEQYIHEVHSMEKPAEEPVVSVNPEPVYEIQAVPVQAEAVPVQAEVKPVQVQEEIKENPDNEMLLENNHHVEPGSRLGESFLKNKSLNDMITDQVKLEFKLSNRPVSSIQSSVGINDRFQYIRELFDGDNKKYTEAVRTLDSMHNVKEAVEYLRNNYKWKKNETSLKFVNLVKRRFQDPVNG